MLKKNGIKEILSIDDRVLSSSSPVASDNDNYNENGFDIDGLDRNGYNINGLNINGLDRNDNYRKQKIISK